MRGSPLIQAAVAAFFILLLAWPVHRLTSPLPAQRMASPAVPEPSPQVAEKNHSLEVLLSGAPLSYSFEYLGHALPVEKADSTSPGSLHICLPASVTDKGLDLMAKVQWPRGIGQNAFEIRLISPDGRLLVSRTLWIQNGKFEGRIPLP